MTTVEPETAPHAHDPPRRRTARSPSLTRSIAASKRSPSPIITFHSTSLSAEHPTGVKNITRKVIKRLEGLGHLEMVEMEEDEQSSSGQDEQAEVEKVLNELGKDALKVAAPTNGDAKSSVAPKAKPDLEIPRKVLHSSIGFFTLYMYVTEGDVRKIIIVLWMALCVIVPADLLRFNSKGFARTYERYLGFLMRESEKDAINGVVWYILGVNFVLSLYPQDIATVAILILSWADTAASTIGRLYGSATRKLPARVPYVGLPLAPRKSLAGFAAATVTGAAIAFGFWGFVAPIRAGGRDITWAWTGGVRNIAANGEATSLGGGGVLGLLVLSIVAGVVSGIAEALDLGSLDDNLTLPIISGGCIYGFLKLVGMAASWITST
ncbi:hypothetical protein BDN70DRAFT_815769 [Pholiota conissans]|uniref:Phosphatidate cytidylyltransferase n=1 Tax=Pholiota conissans TaxID=109636 RepID=A0A9P6CWA5_9AGAR|nr:hypothetical protein BDN70DRAFT_815769 [Pholiota conissans]